MKYLTALSGLVLTSALFAASSLKINGSTTVNAFAAEAAEVLRKETGMNITLDTQGGSSGGISGIADGSIDLGMSSKFISASDRKKYPGVRFVESHVGEDAVALVVSADVWNGGVKAVTKAEIKDLYEGRIRNWKQLGGPGRRVVFFNKEPGRGTWEVFAQWVYGEAKRAPLVSHPEVGGNEEARNKVTTTKGAVTQLSSSWAAGNSKLHALSIELDSGEVVAPTKENIASHAFPMSRPLLFITNGTPRGAAKTFIEFVLSPRGQQLVRKHGYLGIADLER